MIPFNRATVTESDVENLRAAVEAGHISGDGAYSLRCAALLEKELGVGKALLTTSCTHALEMAAFLLDIGRGDEVIVPSFTFVSTANAFVLRGATPVFSDIRDDTLNLDEGGLEALITPRTKAIVPVHYGGIGCEMDAICEVAREHGIGVVEDNAHGLFGKYRGRYLGTFGALATLSFHETKNFTCGEGGALLVNDPRLVERAEIIREKGTDRTRFFRGEVDKYTWVDLGSSYVLSDLLAAILSGQLERRQEIQERRKRIFDRYREGLRDWAEPRGVGLPLVPPHCESAYHLFYLRLPDLRTRDRLIAWLRRREILSVFHYLPLHASPIAGRLGWQSGECPVAMRVSERLLRLPFFTELSGADQERVIDAVRSFSL
ncbi:MAG: dTDP-4-amino-4,6-dideoxygalactose transaminase [Thermoanaerobaculia bacterium]